MAVASSSRSSSGSRWLLWVTRLAPPLVCLLLCAIQAANTFMIAAAERQYRQPPPPALVILLAQLLQLVLALGYSVLARKPLAAAGSRGRNDKATPEPDDEVLPLQDTSKQHHPHTTRVAPASHQLAAAVCVFIATNLSFVALRQVSLHTYVLLMTVQAALVPLLTSWSAGEVPTLKEQLAYLLSPAALLLGGWGALPHRLHGNTLPGMLAALAVAACTAVHHVLLQPPGAAANGRQAAVIMQGGTLQHLAGVVLNAILYVCQLALQQEQEGAADSSWAALQPLHGVIIVGLTAGSFLLPSAVRQLGAGPVTLVQTSALLLAAWLAQMRLWEPVPPQYWIGVGCSVCAVLLSSYSRKQLWWSSGTGAAGLPTSKPSTKSSSCSSQRPLLWAAQLVAAAAVVLCLVPSSNIGRDRYRGSLALRYSQQQADVGSVYNYQLLQHLPVDRGLRIPKDMLAVDADGMGKVLARVDCRLDEDCISTDATCCNFYKARLLDFTARLLAAYGFQREWFAVYGAVIGAVRDAEGMLPFDRDLDIAMTPRLQRFIESTAVREQAWQFGYYICKESPWKVLPHALHPDPVWQAGFQRPVLSQPWQPPPPGVRPDTIPVPTKGMYPHVYLDLWASAPLGSVADGTYFLECDPCPDPRQVTNQGLYHLWANTGWVQVTFKRRASIGCVSVAIPDNAEEHLALVYGPHWRTPDPIHHGKWAQHWNNPRKEPFSGAPDAFTLPKKRGRPG